MNQNLKGGIMMQNHYMISILQRLIDVIIVYALLSLLCELYEIPFNKAYFVLALLGAIFTWGAMSAVGAYRAWRGSAIWHQLIVIYYGWIIVVVLLLFLGWGTKNIEGYSRLVIASWLILTPILLSIAHVAQRLILRWLRKKGRNSRRAVIVGAGDLGIKLAHRIQEADWMGLTLVGFFDDDLEKENTNVLNVPVLGKTKDVYTFVRAEGIEHVYLALPMRSEEMMKQVFDQLQDTTASMFLVPDLFIFELLGARELDVAGLPAFALCETPLTGPYGMIKRIEDIVIASLILLMIWPLLVGIAVAIKLTSKGSILFKQRRYGLHGEKINVYKFRSMTVCENDETVIRQASVGDARVTRLGAFLRRTSLDELPQFINVLQGRMSVVGPRPHAVAHNEQYRKLIKGYMWRHKVKPGITGWAQINGWRGETDTLDKMEKRVEFDIDYIQRWSVWLDLKIVFLTIFKGFINKNAF
ncbi:MAG: undecaprenyl-phosphate glucose phosphotransferase [Zetaproteobacteria bacterium CG2_30_46_52]|nr:MAG: undecaprenyl-phosphate glucose phosphotransferase [Zetaproteobacteria bacterium CG2_30_46_52]